MRKHQFGTFRKLVFLVLVLFSAAGLSHAMLPSITVFAPYIGTLSHTYQGENPMYPKLTDTGLMYGLFAQHLNRKRFMANAFLYYANDVNYSSILGLHAIVDIYFDARAEGKWVAGIGTEYIGISLDAGSSLLTSGLEQFQMDLSVLTPFVRAGRYFYSRMGAWRLTVLPWIGGIWEAVRGEVRVNPSGPTPLTPVDADEDQYFFQAGLNVSALYGYYLRLKAKYNNRFKRGKNLHSVSAQVSAQVSPEQVIPLTKEEAVLFENAG